MSTLTAAPPTEAHEHRVVVEGVTWAEYVAFRDKPDSQKLRMTFDRGRLELMSPSYRHDKVVELLGLMVHEWCQHRRIPRQGAGSTTFRREDLQRGLEPDKCWYFQNAAAILGKDELDLTVDPPPDLCVEVEVTRPLVPKLPVLAALGIPEVWHWRRGQLRVLELRDGAYHETDGSRALPAFPFELVLQTLEDRFTTDETTLMARFEDAVAALD